jgi:hypothetical protein
MGMRFFPAQVALLVASLAARHVTIEATLRHVNSRGFFMQFRQAVCSLYAF